MYGFDFYSGYVLPTHWDGYNDRHVANALDRLKKANRVFYDDTTQEVLLNDISGNRMRHAYNLGVIVEVFSRRFQTLEDSQDSMIFEMTLAGARGVALDTVGKKLKLSRSSVPGASNDDEIYRNALAAKAVLNVCNGDEPSLTYALKVLTDPETITLTEYQPATFYYYLQGTVMDAAFLYYLMYNAKAEGVKMVMINAVKSAFGPFRFANSPLFHIVATNNSFVVQLNVLAATIPTVIAGDYANGQIAIYDGPAVGDVRTIDANGAVFNPIGPSWDFTPTVNFSIAPTVLSYTNIYDYTDGLGMASDPVFALNVAAGAIQYIDILQADLPAVLAGDRAEDWIVIYDGPATGDVRQIDTSGAVDPGGPPGTWWRFTMKSKFTISPTAASDCDIFGDGGKLASVIEP